MVPNRARSITQLTLTICIPPPIVLYNQLPISLLFNHLSIVIILSQRYRQKKTVLRTKPIFKSQCAFQLTHHNCDIAGFVKNHGL